MLDGKGNAAVQDPSHMSDSLASGEDSKKDIKAGYIFANCMVVALGFMQFGIGMNSWSNSQDAFAKQFGWDTDKATFLGDIG